MKALYKLLAVLILFLILKCEKDTHKRIDIEGNVVVILYENFSNSSAKEFYIRFAPLQNCHCYTKGILNLNYVRFGDSYDFNIKDIRIPEDCDEPYSCPVAEKNIGSLSSGNYNFRLKVAGVRNDGILSVTDTAYSLNLAQNNIEVRGSHFRRVFPNTIWGGFSYYTESEYQMGLALIDSLKALGVQPSSLKYGDYYFFTYLNGQPNLNMYNYVPVFNHGKEIGFVYDYAFSEDKLSSLLNKFKTIGTNLYVVVATGKGFRFYSWR